VGTPQGRAVPLGWRHPTGRWGLRSVRPGTPLLLWALQSKPTPPSPANTNTVVGHSGPWIARFCHGPVLVLRGQACPLRGTWLGHRCGACASHLRTALPRREDEPSSLGWLTKLAGKPHFDILAHWRRPGPSRALVDGLTGRAGSLLPPLPRSCFALRASAASQAFGALFTVLTSILVYLDYRYGGTSHTSEQVRRGGAWVGGGVEGWGASQEGGWTRPVTPQPLPRVHTQVANT
jgi:hypothetical protein